MDEDLLNQQVNRKEARLISSYRMSNEYENIRSLINELNSRETVSFKPMMKILSSETEPNVMVISYQDDYLHLVFKSQVDGTFNEVLHETVVGLFGINQLQSPFFAKVLSGSYPSLCPKLITKETSKNCAFVVYEFISGKTLHDWLNIHHYILSDTIGRDLLLIVKDIIHALHYANKTVDFTHYDLHLQNIIITESSRKYIPVIIDYGSSHIKYEGEDYGRTLIEGQIYNREMWYHDIFKVLMAVCYHLDPQVVRLLLIIERMNLVKNSMQLSNKEYNLKTKISKDITDDNLEQMKSEIKELSNRINDINLRLEEINNLEQTKSGSIVNVIPFILGMLSFFITDINTNYIRWYQQNVSSYFAPVDLLPEQNFGTFDEFVSYSDAIIDRNI